MDSALLIDFGSTYTKLRAIDLSERRILGSGQGPSTVTSDITVGMNLALQDLEKRLGKLPSFKYRLASSSAAGGLKMVTIGLVRELTLEAARRAALGAGAKLTGGFSGRLISSDIAGIEMMAPDILLLAGGTDGGDMNVAIHNAKAIANSKLSCPIIYAANRVTVDEAKEILANKLVFFTENVMPELNKLNIEPARAMIRKVFIERIVHAKGIDQASKMFDSVLMPTPAAVLEGARLISQGAGSANGLGDLVVIDPGGATTDVHSIASGKPTTEGVLQRGLPEPDAKRTVEGDLGMRHNATTIVESVGIESIAGDCGIGIEQVSQMLENFSVNPETLPASSKEQALDDALARAALRIAMRRHCGTLEVVYTTNGPVTAQDGKDLTAVSAVIGTGGVIAHSKNPGTLLRSVLYDSSDPDSLRPKKPRLLIDQQYILYACGLLSELEPEVAFEIATHHLTEVNED